MTSRGSGACPSPRSSSSTHGTGRSAATSASTSSSSSPGSSSARASSASATGSADRHRGLHASTTVPAAPLSDRRRRNDACARLVRVPGQSGSIEHGRRSGRSHRMGELALRSDGCGLLRRRCTTLGLPAHVVARSGGTVLPGVAGPAARRPALGIQTPGGHHRRRPRCRVVDAAFGADGAGAYFATQYRVWELLAGCLLSLAVTRSDRLPSRAVRQIVGLLGTALLLVALWLGDSRFGAPFPTSVPAVAGAVLLIFAGVREGSTASAMLSSPPLRALGAVSYPLYLWHWPLLIIAPAVMPGLSPVVVVVMALLAAVATHAAVERPMTDLAAAVLTRGRAHSTSSAVRRWRSRHRTPVRYGTLLMLCVVTVCVTGMAVVRSKPQSTVPDAPAIAAASPTPSEDGTFAGALAARDALVRAGTRLSSWPRTTPTLDQISVPDHLESVPQDAAWADTLGCSIAGSSRSAADCTFGDTDGDVVAVVGDSTAAFTMPAFRQIAERAGSGVQVVNLAQFRLSVHGARPRVRQGGACSDHKDDVVRTLAALRPDVLVVMNTSSEIEVDGHSLSEPRLGSGDRGAHRPSSFNGS